MVKILYGAVTGIVLAVVLFWAYTPHAEFMYVMHRIGF